MNDVELLKSELTKIHERNKRVEINKAWETSLTRKIVLVVLTYLIVGFTLTTIGNQKPWLNAMIPSLGFFLSTLTLPFIKNYWVKYFYKRT